MPQVPDSKDATKKDPTSSAAGSASPANGAEPSELAGLPVETPESAVLRLEDELAQLRDQHLRLAAEYDNYRRRAQRDRAELSDRAQAEVIGKLIDGLDDIERILAGDPTTMSSTVLHDAIQLVDKKLWKELERAGLESIDPVGTPFNPALHEAISAVPAASPEQANLVAATFQPGYRFKGILIRPARVQVYGEPN